MQLIDYGFVWFEKLHLNLVRLKDHGFKKSLVI